MSDKDNMQLPEGKTCTDCWNFQWCNLMYGVNGADRRCDFSPSKFKSIADAVRQSKTETEGDNAK